MHNLCPSPAAIRPSFEGLPAERFRPAQTYGTPTFSGISGAFSASTVKTTTTTLVRNWLLQRIPVPPNRNNLIRLLAAWRKSGHSAQRDASRVNYFMVPSNARGKDSWHVVRSRIENLRELQCDWDSYGAAAISEGTITNADEVVDLLEKLSAEPLFADATSDGSIVIKSRFEALEITIEVDNAFEVGVAINGGGTTRYADPGLNELDEFLHDELNGAR